jgi:hypothetical protein
MSMSTHGFFLTPQNVDTLWMSLYTNSDIRNSNLDETMLKTIFTRNLKPFYDKERIALPSVDDLNAKFITMTAKYIVKKFGMIQEVPPVTFNEIQEERKIHFERELNKKKEEFNYAIGLPVPPVPNFQDKEEQPIDLEVAMKRVLEERKYDIPVFHTVEESVDKKSVTWNNPLIETYERIGDTQKEVDLFSKLKRKEGVDSESNNVTLDMIFNKINKLETYLKNIEDILINGVQEGKYKGNNYGSDYHLQLPET